MLHAENPILTGCYPDPSICRAGEYFYLTTSTFEVFPALPIFRSRDLANWEHIGHAVDRIEQMDFQGIPSSRGIFAPTIRYHEGTYYLVCTLMEPRAGTQGGNFLITASDPAGPWSNPVWLDAEGIDPSIFFDVDGTIWIHGARLADESQWPQQTEVWLRQYDPAAEALTGEERVIWTGALKGSIWAEAPHIFRHQGEYFLLAAEGGTAHHHSVMIAKAASVTGPYCGNPGNPVLTHRHLGKNADVVGAGHADLVEASDGTWWAVLLAMRPYGGYHYNLGRETFLVPVVWEDGWPVFAPGEGRVPHRVEVGDDDEAVTGEQGTAQPMLPTTVPPEDPRWTALRGPIALFAAPKGRQWVLSVRPTCITEAATPSFLGVRQQHMDADITVVLRVDGLAAGERAGLLIRQSEADHVTLDLSRTPSGDVLRAVHRRADTDTVMAEKATADSESKTIRLGLIIRGQDYALTSGGTEICRVDGRTLDTVSTGGFLGLWLGVFATSDGAPSRSTVTLEKFDYAPR